jgi:hypothetical protein
MVPRPVLFVCLIRDAIRFGGVAAIVHALSHPVEIVGLVPATLTDMLGVKQVRGTV